MENMNVNASQVIEQLQEEVDCGNDSSLHMKMRFCAGGEPVTAEVRVRTTFSARGLVNTSPDLRTAARSSTA